MIRHRWIFLGALLLLLAGLLGWWLRVPAVATQSISAEPLEQRLVATGRIMSPERISLGSVVAGTAAQVMVEEGARVEAGELLIRLDSDEAEATVRNAEAALERAQAELRQIETVQRPTAAEAQTRAELELAQARRDYRRAETFAAEGFASPAEAEQRKKALDAAASRLRSARMALLAVQPQGSEYQTAAARLHEAEALLEQARSRLGYTFIRAPSAATVIERRIEPGDIVQPGTPLMLLASAGATLIEVQLDERHLGRIRTGQPALASADAYPERRFMAKVSFIGPAVDPARGAVEVKLTVPVPPEYLRADMTVSVDVLVARRERALTVPRESVRQDEQGAWVLVVRDGRAVRQEVTLGLLGDARVELASGVVPGEAVLLNPGAVAPGQRIREARF